MFSVLQNCAVNEPLFPNLRTFKFWFALAGEIVPFIPLFLSPRTTAIGIGFIGLSSLHKATVPSMLATLRTTCPNLEDVSLESLPRDPMITAAVSGMLLASGRNALRSIHMDSPLAEETLEVICKLPNLRALTVILEGDTSLPTLVLPNLTNLIIEYHHNSDWLKGFRGATLGKLETIELIHCRFERIGDLLEEFERVVLATSTQNMLSSFSLLTSCSWNPNYYSLLPFTQLAHLLIEFSCDDGCSSTVDDDVITTLAQAMPSLKFLSLGNPPCSEFLTGVTARGLAVLAHHCQRLGRRYDSAVMSDELAAALCLPRTDSE